MTTTFVNHLARLTAILSAGLLGACAFDAQPIDEREAEEWAEYESGVETMAAPAPALQIAPPSKPSVSRTAPRTYPLASTGTVWSCVFDCGGNTQQTKECVPIGASAQCPLMIGCTFQYSLDTGAIC
jgi:hypothetical protein